MCVAGCSELSVSSAHVMCVRSVCRCVLCVYSSSYSVLVADGAWCARLVEAETAKSFQDDSISRASAAQEIKEQKSKDRMLPTDEELREGDWLRRRITVRTLTLMLVL